MYIYIYIVWCVCNYIYLYTLGGPQAPFRSFFGVDSKQKNICFLDDSQEKNIQLQKNQAFSF